jgi:hypothetical protein
VALYGTLALLLQCGDCKQITQNGKNLGVIVSVLSLYSYSWESGIVDAFGCNWVTLNKFAFPGIWFSLFLFPQAHKSASTGMPNGRNMLLLIYNKNNHTPKIKTHGNFHCPKAVYRVTFLKEF